ncbi:MAG TPA: Smr/MutS family protein [Xanthobacteraceae bacterium]|jgi:DNA-nicking Smr family endonuclease|nr:Smr/MutS family protein [Xanthobacteraceae bacterium]
MSLERTDKRRHRRRLSEDEHRLWSGVIRSIVPLKRKPSRPRGQDAVLAPGESAPPPARRRAEPAPARHPAPKSAAKPASKPISKPVLPVVGLDRRQKQRLARGTEIIDGRIDLHGRTQSEAHTVLLGFLRRAQAEGARYVLVITGKGKPNETGFSDGRGVLKRQVPLWLRLPEFRLLVLAVEDAHAAHGGAGALYVRLRRARNA